MSTVERAHDCLCNVDMGDGPQSDWMVKVKQDTFKSNFDMRSRELPEMLEEMDAQGVRRAVLITSIVKPSQRATDVRRGPTRPIQPGSRGSQPAPAHAHPPGPRVVRG